MMNGLKHKFFRGEKTLKHYRSKLIFQCVLKKVEYTVFLPTPSQTDVLILQRAQNEKQIVYLLFKKVLQMFPNNPSSLGHNVKLESL